MIQRIHISKAGWLLVAFVLICVQRGVAQDTVVSKSDAPAPRELSTDEQEINAVLQEIFWRVRANDNSAFYENEFSYLRKKMTLDEYLTGIRFRRTPEPNSDSITVLTLDSTEIVEDTALVYLTLTVSGDSAVHYIQSQQRLYRENGRWIKPISTNPRDNDAFYRQIQQYEKDAERESGH